MDEQKKRRQIFSKKMKRAGLLFLIAAVSFFASGFVPAALLDAGCSMELAELASLIFRGIYSLGTIISVILFAGSLHDPLTRKEAEELAETERKEKTGQ